MARPTARARIRRGLTARVLDDLRGEEERVLLGAQIWSVILFLPPLEEEDEPVHRAEPVHALLVEGIQLLHLNPSDAKLGDELTEDPRVRLDCAPRHIVRQKPLQNTGAREREQSSGASAHGSVRAWGARVVWVASASVSECRER